MCISCSSLTNCSKCMNNSVLASSGNCEIIPFYASLKINSENVVTIVFSDSLKNVLNSSNIEVYLNNNTQPFELNFISNYTYSINTVFTNLNENDKLKIHFIPPLFSIESTLLETVDLEIGLFVISSTYVINATLVQMKNAAGIAY